MATDAAVPGAPASRARGTVTLLFADLVGSTELLERLGDEEADVVRRDFFRILRSAIAAQGGREVKSLGDGVMATFESAFDAVSCAVRIQRALSDPVRHIAPHRLQVRIGVHAGEPIRDEDDYFGSTVVVARRLCETARPAQILASEVVRGLVGSRGGLHFTEANPVRLKGFSNPVGVCEIVWNASVLDLRLPQPLEQAEGDAIAGREEDLQRLSEIWADAVQRERLRLVLLKGDPGIGKTRTAAELAHDVHASGALVLYGRCEEGLAAPYHPFITALDGLGAALPGESAPGRLGSAAEEVARLALEASRLPAALQLQAEEARYRLFKEVAGMLRAAAGTRPTVLVLDDLHWADRSSLLLLGFLVDELNATPLVLLGTYRDVELDLGHPLTQTLASLRRRTSVDEIHLQGLSLPAVEAMVASIAGQKLPRRGRLLAQALHAETNGNPFFIAEIIRHLIESGRLYRQEGRWTSAATSITELDIPASVWDVIDRRLFRLSPSCRRALAVAAVIGAEFDLELLERVSGLGEPEVLAALEEAIDATVVAEVRSRTGRYTFTHALIRQSLLGELSTTRRLWLHQQVGEALEKSPEHSVQHLPQLAHHFSESGPSGRIKAVNYAVRAGARAAELLAYDEAAAHFRGALALMDETDADDRVRCEAQLALGDALWRAGERGEARRLAGEAAGLARTLDDAELLARAALGYGVGLGGFGYSDQADTALLELLDEALTALGERDSALRVRVMARLAVELYYTRDRERRVMLSDEALSIARRLDDPAVLLVALYSREKSIEGPDAIDERLAAAHEMLAIATDIGDRPMQFFAHHFLLAALLETGDLDGVDAAIEACDRIATELAQPVLLWQTAVFRAMQAMRAGRFEEGFRYAQDALALGQGAQGAIAAVHFGTQSFQYHWATGRLAEIEEPTRMFAQRYHSSAWRAGLTFLYTELGRDAEARTHFERFASRGFRAIRREGNWVSIIAFLALACADLKDRERAPKLYSMLKPYEDRSVVVGAGANCIGSVSLYLGHLATVMQRWDDAEAHFGRAVIRDEQRRNRPFVVYSQLAWAEMLLERDGAGDRDHAAELVTQARPVASEMGMQTMVQRAAAMQERLSHPRRPEGHAARVSAGRGETSQ